MKTIDKERARVVQDVMNKYDLNDDTLKLFNKIYKLNVAKDADGKIIVPL